MLYKIVITAVTAILLTLTGLNSSMAGHAFGGGCAGKGLCSSELEDLSDNEIEGLKLIGLDEKLARDCYSLMADRYGYILFFNLARSEQLHLDGVNNLFNKYQLGENNGSILDYPDLVQLAEDCQALGEDEFMEALQLGGEIEETDIRDIEAQVMLVDNDDIISTYENLLCGSQNHLRALVKQIEIRGGEYQRQILSEDELAAIVGPPVARKCGR